MSEIYVEDKKSALQKEFYDKLNEYWGGESRLMYSEEYGNSSYIPMDMDAVRFIDNRNEKDMFFYSSVERLFPYDRFPLLTSTMFKCLKPGCFRELYELNAVKNTPCPALSTAYACRQPALYAYSPALQQCTDCHAHCRVSRFRVPAEVSPEEADDAGGWQAVCRWGDAGGGDWKLLRMIDSS